ncbi:MAG TPA: addiction module protein [Polyangia bacterium]
MDADVVKVLAAALKLPAKDRAALAGQLLRSLEDAAEEPDVEEAWAEEIGRRVTELDTGAAQTVSWSQAREIIGSDEPPR